MSTLEKKNEARMAQGPLTADELLTAPQQKLIAHAVSTPEWKEGSFCMSLN